MIIASSIKRKSLETEKIFQDLDDVELIEETWSDEEETLLVESKDPRKDALKRKFLVYEEE